MAPTILYLVSVLGGLGLYLLVRGGGPDGSLTMTRLLKAIGAVLGLGVFGYLVMAAPSALAGSDEATRPGVFYIIFSVIAIASAIKLITHKKPVYSAMYFVLVVLSSAGLFLLLEAEFLAFALIIVYAGAIVITYMFVLMLAQQAPEPGQAEAQAEYDLNPREPASGAIVGFILLALLSRMIFEGAPNLPTTDAEVAKLHAWESLSQMPKRMYEQYIAGDAEGVESFAWGEAEAHLEVAAGGDKATLYYTLADGTDTPAVALPEEAMPENIQTVGLGLILKFPVSLELAGIILLMAMFGAVVLARRQIELTDDAKREAAGLPRLGHHDEPGRGDTTTGGAAEK